MQGVSFAVDDKRFEEAFAEVGPIRWALEALSLTQRPRTASRKGEGLTRREGFSLEGRREGQFPTWRSSTILSSLCWARGWWLNDADEIGLLISSETKGVGSG